MQCWYELNQLKNKSKTMVLGGERERTGRIEGERREKGEVKKREKTPDWLDGVRV